MVKEAKNAKIFVTFTGGQNNKSNGQSATEEQNGHLSIENLTLKDQNGSSSSDRQKGHTKAEDTFQPQFLHGRIDAKMIRQASLIL